MVGSGFHRGSYYCKCRAGFYHQSNSTSLPFMAAGLNNIQQYRNVFNGNFESFIHSSFTHSRTDCWLSYFRLLVHLIIALPLHDRTGRWGSLHQDDNWTDQRLEHLLSAKLSLSAVRAWVQWLHRHGALSSQIQLQVMSITLLSISDITFLSQLPRHCPYHSASVHLHLHNLWSARLQVAIQKGTLSFMTAKLRAN